MSRRRKPPVADTWYESEPSTRKGLIQELQRIAQRTRARPWRVLLLAAALTGLIGFKVASKKPLVEAEVILALTEGKLAQKDKEASVTIEQLRDYVNTVLISDDKLVQMIEKQDLFPIRKTMGNQFAIAELREQIEITVWKNSFVYYDEDLPNAEHSARIGLTVMDTNPDRAIAISRGLASIAIESNAEHQRELTSILAKDIAQMREGLAARLAVLGDEHAKRANDLLNAKRDNHPGAAAGLTVVLSEIEHDQKKLELELATIARSRDAVADRIAEAGLDVSLTVVEEHHPDRTDHGPFVLIMVLVVVGIGALLGSALVFGAFDSRLHDLDDLTRLGVPVLGHVPGFPGDHVGSLQTRGARRRRVPSFLRWRSQR